MRSAPIGVFDSGYGGLTVLKEIVRLLPEYDYIYLGDNARTPYGNRSFEVVLDYTRAAVTQLFDRGCRLVILACNTASAKALRSLQQKYLPKRDPDLRILGVIRPSVESLSNLTRNGHVGLLATRGTVNSDSYRLEIEKLYGSSHLHLTQVSCPLWVPLIESGELDSEGTAFFVRRDIETMMALDPEIDTVILACTHYPLLRKMIRSFLPPSVGLIEQGPIVASALKDYLVRHPEMEESLSSGSSVTYLTTEYGPQFDALASRFTGDEVVSQTIHY